MEASVAPQRFNGLLRPLQRPEKRPAPLPKRPKGQWLIGLLIVGLTVAFCLSVWNGFFRYEVYGVVSGRVVESSSALDGALEFLHVREGDRVRQGDPLFTVDSVEMRHRYAQIGDEMRTAQAELQAQAANLKWQAAFGLDQNRGSAAMYFETWGRLLQSEASRDFAILQRERAKALLGQHYGAAQDYDRFRLEVEGLNGLIVKLNQSLDEQKDRVAQVDALLRKDSSLSAGLEQNGLEQLLPFRRKIEALEAERTRLLERMQSGLVRASANGVVVKVLHLAGERCRVGDPIISLLDEGSLHVVLYMPQEYSESLEPIEDVNLVLDPYPDPFVCRVERLGARFEPAPEAIKRHYREGQRLLPVYLDPQSGSERWMALRVGEVVKLPYSLFGHGKGRSDAPTSKQVAAP